MRILFEHEANELVETPEFKFWPGQYYDEEMGCWFCYATDLSIPTDHDSFDCVIIPKEEVRFMYE